MKPFLPLPQAIENIDVPVLFSPTSLGKALECSLAAVAAAVLPAEERLPPDPRTILGTVFHRLVELAVKGQLDAAPDSASAIRSSLSRLLAEKDRELASTDLAHYVPLSGTISYRDFLDRRARAIDNARRHLSGSEPVVRSIGAATGIGAERPLVSLDLRLKGRVDFLEQQGDAVVIRDLKTGYVRDSNGAIAAHIVFQMRLYGLLAMKTFPGKRVRLFIDHQQSEELPFEIDDAAETNEQLSRLLERLAPGTASASALATMGPQCRWCDVRHLCPRYRVEAPSAWPVPRTDSPLPMDVWGPLAEPPRRSERGGYSLRLRDDAGRHVAVVALDERHGPFGELRSSDRLWLFGLEARGEVRNLTNEYSHPTNFRELATTPAERRAYRLRVFRDAA